MAKIKWTEKAAGNLQAIYDYISKDSNVYAHRFVRTLVLSTIKLESSPLIGRTIPEFENPALREIIFKNYRIAYRVSKENMLIEILAIAHASQDFEKFFTI